MGLSFPPDRFWQITPRELSRELKAHAVARQRAQNDNAWLAWHIAALTRIEGKRFPKLSALQVKAFKEKTRQSQEEIAHNLKMVFLAFNPTPEELEKFNGR